jgi:transcriptional regulator GlxA family with amidase domain
VVAFDGVVLGDLAIPCEVFGRARDATGVPLYRVRVCSVTPTVALSHLSLVVPNRLTVLRRADTIIVPGVDDLRRPVPPQIVRCLRQALDRGMRVASICTGAFLLARTGALDGRRATTHWAAAAHLASRFPRVTVDPNVLYVDQGAVLTSAGAAAGMDLCLHLVRRDFGAAAAARVARAAVMPLERTGGQAQFIVHEIPETGHATFGPLLEWIEQHLDHDLSLAALAGQAGMSTRTLSRRFQEHVGTTPGEWVTRARLRQAQRFLETTDLSIEQVAQAAGFGAPTVMRERFRAVMGTSPIAYRQAFRSRLQVRRES